MNHSKNPIPNRILIVDDEVSFIENIAERLESRGYEVFQANSGQEALNLLKQEVVDLALVDIKMPGMDGMTLLGKLKEIDEFLEVVIVTGQGTVELAVEAIQKGAFHFITKPVRLKELELLVRKALEKRALEKENSLFREERRRRQAQQSVSIVAVSDSMTEVLDHAGKIAETNATVLIEGETGTGKEVLAEYIHRTSNRSEKLFSVLNCAALSETLVDSELFGYEKGAFTGAIESRPGIFEVTDGGTLLLDEIGDMTLSAQVRLLRVLEKGVCRRVGAMREKKVDVRILAATNHNLENNVAEGRFREDLFHRLNVFTLEIPPLRERAEDLSALSIHFLRSVEVAGTEEIVLNREAEGMLLAHAWPGNIRELAHTIERAAFAARIDGRNEIQPNDLGLTGVESSEEVLISLDDAQRRHVQKVLVRVDGNRKKASEILGVSERHIYRLIQKNEKEDESPPPNTLPPQP